MNDVLSYFADVFNGKTPSKAEQRAEGHPVLKIKDVDDHGKFVGQFDSFVEVELANKLQAKQVQLGDTLILNAAHNADYVGSKVYKVDQDVVGALATGEWLIVRPNPNLLDAAFAYHWLTQKTTRQRIRKLVKGIHLYPTDVSQISVSFPTLPEQRRIAAILDKADAIRALRRQSMAKHDRLLMGVFLEMFGDPVTNPKGWEIQSLSELGTLERGKSKHRPRNAPELLGGPYPLIQTGEVANANGYIKTHTQTYSELGLAQSKMWPAGTLCITIAANIAKTAILTFDACFPDSIVGFTPNELTTTEFIQCWLSFRQKELEENAPESAQKNINLKILRELQVPLPPIESQRRFTGMARKIESLKDISNKAAAKMNEFFQALQQCAFTGKLFTEKAAAAAQQELFAD